MQVTKQDGSKTKFILTKIETRIRNMCFDLDKAHVDHTLVAVKAMKGAYDGITTQELDELAAEAAASLTSKHPDYALLAGRILASSIQKHAPKTFLEAMEVLHANTNSETGEHDPLVSDEVVEVARRYAGTIERAIRHQLDFNRDYFSMKTLERSYLQRSNGTIVETPQYMMMRVAIGLHGEDIPNVTSTYFLMAQKKFTHATPTLFNAGTVRPQMISCLTGEIAEDSMTGIYKTLHDVAMLSKHGAGIGITVDKVRSKGSNIRGGGTSDGIIPMLRVFNETARYSNQLGKRKGSFAMYLNPAHPDTPKFLDLKKNTGNEHERARDLFLAMWCPDVFFQRVLDDGAWTFFDPHVHQDLYDSYGEDFTAKYNQLEADGAGIKTIRARDLWAKIIEAQIETGVPYVLARDHINANNMQSNIGPVKTSNLCAEITLYTDPETWATCVLSSIAVNEFYNPETNRFNWQDLRRVAGQVVINLNRAIDRNFFPIPEAEKGAKDQRPLGIGIQGLADLAALMKLDFDSEEFLQLQARIMENIQYAAIEKSADLAETDGSYPYFEGSPWQKGILHKDGWETSETLDWDALREKTKKGMRNSLLTALMPTASTSQILGNNECFEAFTSNIYVRKTLSGEFVVVNKHLVRDLCELGLWNDHVERKVIANGGSVQGVDEIPAELQSRYKTIWEIKQRHLLDMAASRAPFVDQTQSMNLWFASPNFNAISNAIMYGWQKGLKTLNYYIRTKSATASKQFTLTAPKPQSPPVPLPTREEAVAEAVACSLDNPDACDSCSG